MSEWISVNERLPEPGEDVLVCVRRESDRDEAFFSRELDVGHIDRTQYLGGGDVYWHVLGRGAAVEVTHWQLLPPLPE